MKLSPCLAILLITSSAFALEVESSAIKNGKLIAEEQVFDGFGCSGKNVSPDLTWSAGPKGTESYAVTMYDPDAPTGSGWWHWLVFNIPADVTRLEKGFGSGHSKQNIPGVVQSKTDFGKPGYGGPCPPPGNKPHHYVFTVYALKTKTLQLDADSSGAMVGFQVRHNKLDEGKITAKYGR